MSAEVVFHEPVTLRLINGHANVDTIRFYADAPTVLLAAAHAQLAIAPRARRSPACSGPVSPPLFA